MFKLQRLNVIKIVDSKVKRDRLVKEGFVELQIPQPSPKDIDYNNMNYQELKSLAAQKGINTNKMKKEDIIRVLIEAEA